MDFKNGMNKRIKKKLIGRGQWPPKQPEARGYRNRFPFENHIVEAYLRLQEIDPSHPLLSHGSVDQESHFRPSPEYWDIQEFNKGKSTTMSRLHISTKAGQDYGDRPIPLGGYLFALQRAIKDTQVASCLEYI